MFLPKRQEITSACEDVEKKEPSCTVGRSINWCSHYGKQYSSSSKNIHSFKHIYTHTHTQQILYTYMHTHVYKHTHTLDFIHVHAHTHIHIHNGIVYNHKNGRKSCHLQQYGWNESIRQSKIRQTKTNTVLSHLHAES